MAVTATLPLWARAMEIFTNDELPLEFGWIAWLSPRYQRVCAGEIHTALEAPASEKELFELLDSWRATAEIVNSPELMDEIAQNRKSDRFASIDDWLNTRHTV